MSFQSMATNSDMMPLQLIKRIFHSCGDENQKIIRKPACWSGQSCCYCYKAKKKYQSHSHQDEATPGPKRRNRREF